MERREMYTISAAKGDLSNHCFLKEIIWVLMFFIFDDFFFTFFIIKMKCCLELSN